MTSIQCPNCLEHGKLPEHLLHSRIKCKSCGQSFIPKAESTPTNEPVGSEKGASLSTGARKRKGDIEVEGLDDASWSVAPGSELEASTADDHGDSVTENFAVASEVTTRKTYKVLTQKDPYFKGKFELALLEEALNYYAGQGWIVRSMATPLVTGFSGGPKEEIVVLLER